MKTVVAHGYLRDLIPEGTALEASSVVELLNGIIRQTPELQKLPGRPFHQVRVEGFDTAESLYQPTDQTEIHIVPDFSGEKEGGFFQIALGAVLIGVGIAFPGTWVSIGSFSFGGTGVALFGATLALGGLVQLMSPSPEMDLSGSERDEGSRILGAPKNTVRLGTRIPILYGERRVYGHYISFNIDATEVTAPGDDVEAAIDPPPPARNINFNRPTATWNNEVTISWTNPTSSEVNNFSYTDHLGNSVSPFENGTDHIERVVLTAWYKNHSERPGDVSYTAQTLLDEPFDGQTSYSFPEYSISGTVKFGVHLVYDNGESSDVLKTSQEYDFYREPRN